MSTPAPSSRPASGGAVIGSEPVAGRFRIEERLGGGGMGVVYRATDTKLGREVALKFLSPHLHSDPTARQRLLQEARAAGSLDHPHVAAVYDVGEADGGRLYVAMAYYEGETLEARIARGPLAADEAIGLALQIASGLDAAHRVGIVHRDVKPANVIVVPGGMPDGSPCAKMLDFGIAKVEDADLTQTGESLGTACYMSPEQFRGEPTDARSDVWGLGTSCTRCSRRDARSVARMPPPSATPCCTRPHHHWRATTSQTAWMPSCCGASRRRQRRATRRWQNWRRTSRACEAGRLRRRAREPPSALAPEAPALQVAKAVSRLWRWVATGLAVVALALAWGALRPGAAEAKGQRLVVLPFRASGADAEPLAEGLVEAVTSKLGGLRPLRERVRVIPASEVEAGMTPSQAYEKLGATLVVEGSVSVEGDAVRVSLGLVEVGPDGAVQGETRQFDDARGSAFALQDMAALEVADLLRVEIGAEAQAALASGGTDDPEANALYLRGRGVLRNQQSDADLERARSLFEDAIARDPGFALAHAALAEAQWQTYNRTFAIEWADRALASGQRALALDDGLAEVHVSMAIIYQGRQQFENALTSVGRALEIDPANAEAVRRQAKIYADMGDAPEAERAFKRAIALAPDLWRPRNSLGVFYLAEGRAADAAEQFRLGLELDPVNLSLFTNLGVASVISGDFEKAEESFAEVLRLNPEDADAAFNLVTARTFLGDYRGAVEAAKRAVALRPDDYEAHESLAEAQWLAPGQRDQARIELRTTLRLAREHLAVGRDPGVLKVMARVFALSGQRDSARVYLREIGERISPEAADVQDVYVVGVTHELAGQRAEALSWLRSALDRGFGSEQIKRSPWLRDLRADSLASSLLTLTP